MITKSEGAVLMQHTVTASKALLLENGYMNPSLYIFNTKEDLHINEALFGSAASTVAYVSPLDDDTIFKGTNLTEAPVYITVITFQFQEQKDADNIQKIMDVIASAHKPDMMGVVLSALYRTYTEKERGSVPKNVLEDPSAVRILHSFFYTKKEKKASVQNIPFVNRGKFSEELISSDISYDMTFMDSGWLDEDKENIPRFRNPYKQGGLSHAA